MLQTVETAAKAAGLEWREGNYLLLRRGPYVIAAGMDESLTNGPKLLQGRFVNFFDSLLRVQTNVSIDAGSRYFLLDLDAARTDKTRVLASACKAVVKRETLAQTILSVEGIEATPAIVLLESPRRPKSVSLAGKPLESFGYSADEKLLRVNFENAAHPRDLEIEF